MTTPEERLATLRGAADECDGGGDDDELLRLLLRDDENPHPVCLACFEPSDAMPAAQCVGTAIRARAAARAGCRVRIVVADTLALLGGKMDGGDWARVRDAARRNVGELEAALKALGVGVGGEVEFLSSSDEILRRRAAEYWGPLVMDVAQKFSVQRVLLGRDEKKLTAGQFLSTIMQCADVVFFQADICHMAMDQREMNLLARDYCDASGRDKKPVILSYNMLPDLKKGQKINNDQSSAIFMGDDKSKVNNKIKTAFCPPAIVDGNPCLEYIKCIIFPWFGRFDVLRAEANGGNKTYNQMQDVFVDYCDGALHPADVKNNLSKAINEILQAVRDQKLHFKSNNDAEVLVDTVKSTQLSSTENLPSSMPMMTAEERFKILQGIAEECTEEAELRWLLQEKPNPICYDGFEPSGRMHIAQGVGKAISINKMLKARCRVKIWIADWFAMLNNKMGGDLNKIRTVGSYMIEIWKALGMNVDGVEFLWASEEIEKRGDEYWSLVMDISQKRNFKRIVRCSQIMGRRDTDALTAAQIMYPLMQCADIFFLKVDICQMGMDQRKVNVLAREYCNAIRRNNKPIILSHHILPGIKEGQQKMSKSDPSSAIFMEDDESQVNSKIAQAFCPQKITEGNPCLEYIKYIVFPWFERFELLHKDADGGSKTYNRIEELFEDYASGALHPDDVKPALAKAINQILQPVRDHFSNNPDAKVLLETVKAYKVTN
ncbi:tyrosine--tRNA ligase 1, cytoplasmic-like [Panicum virgatum]|nr:tyrosine--tRNA ligase 1, cytoplasmic-like [Panicum virgatum]